MNGIVFNIQKFCTNDGPGIRTTVFLKGCPLHCVWCHNPESQRLAPEILYNESRCLLCGACVKACGSHAHTIRNGAHIFHRDACVTCGDCTFACSQNTLEMAGELMSTDEVMNEVLKDRVFYKNSGGGLTISGGEPLLQFDFSCDIFKRAKSEGLHTCIETCGFVETEKICEIAKYTDIFLYDWKLTDEELHKKYTGIDNALIKRNLYAIAQTGAKIILRCPIIPGINDNEAHFSGIAELSKSIDTVLGIEIEPYHSLGIHKYGMSGKNAMSFRTPEEEEIRRWIEMLRAMTDVEVKKA